MVADSPVRARILDIADELFYQRGIHAVGIDEVVARSRVAKTTLYSHFGSKDQLIAAYLRRRSETWQRYLEADLAVFPGTPLEAIDHVFEMIAEGCTMPAFRGCPFINFVVEFPDRTHPAWEVCLAHRRWLHDLLARLARAGQVAKPDHLAVQLCLLYDAAMVGSLFDDAGQSAASMRDASATLARATMPNAGVGSASGG
jgi:AcrR family transcriptional regulator